MIESRLSMRERARMVDTLAEQVIQVEAMYTILVQKVEAIERLLAAHHGAETMDFAQCKDCETCGPLLSEEPETA